MDQSMPSTLEPDSLKSSDSDGSSMHLPSRRINLKHVEAVAVWRSQHFGSLTGYRRLPVSLLFFWDGASKAILRLQVDVSVKINAELPPSNISLSIFIYPESINRLSLSSNSSEHEELLDFHLSDLPSLAVPQSPWQPGDDVSEHAQELLYQLAKQKSFSLRFPGRIVPRSTLYAFCAASSAGELSTAPDRADPKRLYNGYGRAVAARDLCESAPAYSESPVQAKDKKRRRSVSESAEELKENNSKKRPRTKGPGLEARIEKLEQLLPLSEKLEQLLESVAYIEKHLLQISGVVDRLPEFGTYVDKRFSSIEEQLPGLEGRVEKLEQLPESVACIEEQLSRISGIVEKLPSLEDYVNRQLSRMETESIRRLCSAADVLETRRQEMFESMERSARRMMEELRKEMSQARVSNVVDSRPIYMATARNWYRLWRGMTMAGTTVIHKAMRKVWRE